MSPIVKSTKNSAPAKERVRASINPDNASLGLVNDIDLTITDAMTLPWDYNGQQPVGPALCVEYTDDNGTTYQEYYSAGKSDDWEATEDGETFESVSGKTQISSQTNFMMFMTSLADCGFPKDDLDANVKVIVGTKGHFLRVVIERAGLIRREGQGEQRKPAGTLLMNSLIALPGADDGATKKPAAAKAGAKGAASVASKAAVAGKANGAAKSTPAAEPAGDTLDERISAVIIELLSENDGKVPKKKIGPAMFEAFKDDPKNRNKAVARASSSDFLNSLKNDGVIAYDGATLSMPD